MSCECSLRRVLKLAIRPQTSKTNAENMIQAAQHLLRLLSLLVAQLQALDLQGYFPVLLCTSSGNLISTCDYILNLGYALGPFTLEACSQGSTFPPQTSNTDRNIVIQHHSIRSPPRQKADLFWSYWGHVWFGRFRPRVSNLRMLLGVQNRSLGLLVRIHVSWFQISSQKSKC